jgi:hypothetical protein
LFCVDTANIKIFLLKNNKNILIKEIIENQDTFKKPWRVTILLSQQHPARGETCLQQSGISASDTTNGRLSTQLA